jgi:hypothetical protein
MPRLAIFLLLPVAVNGVKSNQGRNTRICASESTNSQVNEHIGGQVLSAIWSDSLHFPIDQRFPCHPAQGKLSKSLLARPEADFNTNFWAQMTLVCDSINPRFVHSPEETLP